ncbi:MAG: 1-phosphofructokinase [Caulobacteraceae bacterium]
MIKTVTMNPAVDKTVEIDDSRIGEVNRITSMRIDAGGKGINVSKTIKALKGCSTATGILAGKNGEYIKEYLDCLGIENDFLFVQGNTRTNIKVVDKLKGTNTDINEPGPGITREELSLLEFKIFSGLDRDSILVLSGSTPLNVSTGIYKEWVERAKLLGVRVLLDADGALLREAIKAGPYLIKPNINELEKLFGRKLGDIDAVIEAAKRLVAEGIEIIAVSLGADGAIFVTKNTIIRAEGIAVDARSTVGAGDAMLAALAFALEQCCTLDKAVTLSVASSTASVTASGTQPPELDDILYYEKQVRYYCLK